VRGFHHTAGDDIETASFSNSHGPIQTISVTIQPSDFGFSSFGCGPFTKVG
jgi:hypothetical protein